MRGSGGSWHWGLWSHCSSRTRTAFVPGRHARLKDFVIDAGAAFLGVVIVWGVDVAASLLRPAQSWLSSKSNIDVCARAFLFRHVKVELAA
jgi:hypothetical protein